ncbi:hypothetical protein AGMMS4952_10840 [Spirochaetia bacterium]|nr:hypothetical protein AGMMS4952_10840 [Spirochaetia bacterium]
MFPHPYPRFYHKSGKFRIAESIEADIDKKQWNLIKQENPVFIVFSGAKIYSKDEVWSDYNI